MLRVRRSVVGQGCTSERLARARTRQISSVRVRAAKLTGQLGSLTSHMHERPTLKFSSTSNSSVGSEAYVSLKRLGQPLKVPLTGTILFSNPLYQP